MPVKDFKGKEFTSQFLFRMALFVFIFVFIDSVTLAEEETLKGVTAKGALTHIKADPFSELKKIRVLDLLTAQRFTLVENPTLAAAQARIEQAQERVAQALSAWFPRLEGRGSGTREWLSDGDKDANESIATIAQIINPATTISFEDPVSTFEATISGKWTLFDGFRREFSIASARFGEQESQEARKDAQRLLLAAVAQNFFEAQLARERISIEEADELFNRNQMKAAKARQRIGTGSLSDVLNFEVQVNRARFNTIRARREYEVAMIGLAALLGVPDASFHPQLQLTPLKRESEEELFMPQKNLLIEYAQKNRPDVLQSNYQVEQARAEVGIARAEYFPKIDLRGSFDGERTKNPRFRNEDFGYQVGAVLTYDLFDGGNRKAKHSEAKLALIEAQNDLRNLLNTVSSEVNQALSRLNATQEQLIIERKNVVLSTQQRDLVEKEYAAGQASLTRLNEAQRDLTTAQSRLALALASLRDAWQNLESKTGRILVPFEYKKDSDKVSYVPDSNSQTP